VVGSRWANGLIVVVLALIIEGYRRKKSSLLYVATAVTLGVGVWYFPKIWKTNVEYEFLVNSLIITVLTMIISLSIGMLAGYGLARFTGISGAVILIVALGFRALPRTAFVLPYFFGAVKIDTWLEAIFRSSTSSRFSTPGSFWYSHSWP